MCDDKTKVVFGSKPFLIFLVYVIFIWLCEATDLVFFLCGWKSNYVYVSAVLSGGITLILGLKLCKRIDFACTSVGLIYFSGAAFIACFGFYKSVLPDVATDTWNYHIVAQSPGFVNYFDDHFALGNFQVWGFRLGDRLFYLFRVILGYRMGTVLNTLVLILAFYQLIQLMQMFNQKLARHVSSTIVELVALFICLSQWILFDLGIYYVDILAFPIALEVIRLLMKVRDNSPSQIETVYFAILNGFLLAFKMTNVVYVIPALILFIVISKNIKFKTLVISSFLCVVPCIIYLIFAYVCTGNPVYPYYNAIFKSDLYPLINWKDGRWGPTTIIEKLTWLPHAVFNPAYRLSEIYDEFYLRYVIAFILFMTTILLYLQSKFRKQKADIYHIELVLFVMASSILWGFSTGYGRYFMFGAMMMEFIAFEAVAIIYSKFAQKKVGILLSLGGGILAGVLAFFELAMVTNVLCGTEWSWRYSFPSKNNANLEKNMKYLLHDQKYKGTFDTSNIDAIVTEGYTCWAYWFKSDAYIFQTSYLGLVSADKQRLYKAKLAKVLNENDQVYDIVTTNTDMDAYAKRLADYGIEIDNVFQNDTNLGSVKMVKLKPKSEPEPQQKNISE